jgi:hypothetical protein
MSLLHVKKLAMALVATFALAAMTSDAYAGGRGRSGGHSGGHSGGTRSYSSRSYSPRSYSPRSYSPRSYSPRGGYYVGPRQPPGSFPGGVGSSHKGGSYSNPYTGNHYQRRK